MNTERFLETDVDSTDSALCTKNRESDYERIANDYRRDVTGGETAVPISSRKNFRNYSVYPWHLSKRKKSRKKISGRKLRSPVLGLYLATNNERMKRLQTATKPERITSPRHVSSGEGNENIEDEINTPNGLESKELIPIIGQRFQGERGQYPSDFYYRIDAAQFENPLQQNHYHRNCETYTDETPDCGATIQQNWQNINFDITDSCFENCYCCSSQINKCASCITTTSTIGYQKSPLIRPESEEVSVPWKRDNQSKTPDYNPSAYANENTSFCPRYEGYDESKGPFCTHCSRKCTPSKASLFVETGESGVDLDDSKMRSSMETIQFRDKPVASRSNDSGRMERGVVTKSKSEFAERQVELQPCKNIDGSGLRSRKCSANCKARPSRSDEFPSVEKYFDEIPREGRDWLKSGRRELNYEGADEDASADGRRDFGREERRRMQDDSQSCETRQRSFWSGVQKGKFWSQVQDACKNAVKFATTHLSQIARETPKSKCPKHASNEEFNERRACEKHVRKIVSKCCQTGMPHEEVFLSELCNYDKHEIPYCRNLHCVPSQYLNMSYSPDNEAYPKLCKNVCHGHRQNEKQRRTLDKRWYLDPRNGVGIHEMVHPRSSGKEPLKDLQYYECCEPRRRGGSDGNSGVSKRQENNSRSKQRSNLNPSTTNQNNVRSIDQKRKKRPSINEENRSSDESLINDGSNSIEEHQRAECVTTADAQVDHEETGGDVCVNPDAILVDNHPEESSLGEENGELGEETKFWQQTHLPSSTIADFLENETHNASHDTEGRGTSKWATSTVQEVDSMVQALSSKQKAMKHNERTPKKPSMSQSRKVDSRHPMLHRPTSPTRYASPKNAKIVEHSKAGTSSIKKKLSTPSKNSQTSTPTKNGLGPSREKNSTPATSKGTRCLTIKRHQIICVDDLTKEMANQVDDSCFCSPPEIIPPLDGLTTAETSKNETSETEVLTEYDEPEKTQAYDDFDDTNVAEAGTIDNFLSLADEYSQTDEVTEEVSPAEIIPSQEVSEKSTAENPYVIAISEQATTSNEDFPTIPEPEVNADIEKTEPSAESTVVTESTANGQESVVISEYSEPVNDTAVVQDENTPLTSTAIDSIAIPEDNSPTVATSDAGMQNSIEDLPENAINNEETYVTERDRSTVGKTRGAEADITNDAPSITPAGDEMIDHTVADLSGIPIECTREHNGNRTYVAVQMQTSSTILTKILSEFQVGNKRKRIVMSIKLQCESDRDNADERDAESRDMEIQTTNLYVASAVTKQWPAGAEYSSEAVTPGTGIMEINDQADQAVQQDEPEYFVHPPRAIAQPTLLNDSTKNHHTSLRRRKMNADKTASPGAKRTRNLIADINRPRVRSSRNGPIVDTISQNNDEQRRPLTDDTSNTDREVTQRRYLRTQNTCGPCGRKKP